jgi:hypothetical protein
MWRVLCEALLLRAMKDAENDDVRGLALPILRHRLEVKNDRNIFDRIISAGRR